jgi:hypothetical protein
MISLKPESPEELRKRLRDIPIWNSAASANERENYLTRR